MAVKIFFCYAHEDEPLLNKLKSHLKPLQRQGLIDVWYDRDISAGTEWEREISEQLNSAQIILLLISPDFMDSDYCYSIEMKRALERHERGEAHVIPIILRSVYWQGVLGHLQALPKDAKPAIGSSWHNLDEALFDIVKGIYGIILTFFTQVEEQAPINNNQNHTRLARKERSFPNILKNERILRGWSQERLGNQLGCGAKTVSAWENGKALPSPYYLQQLCGLFGKNTLELGLIHEQDLK